MRLLAVLPLLLVLASCGTGGSVARTAPTPQPVIAFAPVGVSGGVIAPAVLLWYADPRCEPSVTRITLPPLALRDCLLHEARRATLRIVTRDGVKLGPQSPCYPFTGVERANCLDVAARALPGVSYGHSGRYVTGSLYGRPWTGCVAGQGSEPLFISLAEPGRVNALHGWESANHYLYLTIDQLPLTDGAIVGEATTAALAACGVS